MKFIVIGLGNFGSALAVRLTEMGHEVIGVDNNMAKVERVKNVITHTVCLDATNEDAVSSLPLKDANAVIVAIGEDGAASLLTTALLKQLKVKRIIGRIISDLQKTVLLAMSIEEYVLPEEESAERLAMRLDLEEVIDSFKISDKYSIVEGLVPKKYAGMTIGEADFINSYKVLVLTLIREQISKSGENLKKEATGIATASTLLHEGDVLVLFGELANIRSLLKQD
ncbi:potassium channel family protein [Daejeonella lutea]|uniref:Trk system potassium uptake protein TrkA n=1 Tax=Daejeonella lutea TaxID=572036 RepID=A0A1T5API0_9SPHI|nr:TrkA family potassium uptake protein [Daejeonella lutea]SKB36503.1 trk system potassium uptake protein TrkA [Daejeonella lutea]